MRTHSTLKEHVHSIFFLCSIFSFVSTGAAEADERNVFFNKKMFFFCSIFSFVSAGGAAEADERKRHVFAALLHVDRALDGL